MTARVHDCSGRRGQLSSMAMMKIVSATLIVIAQLVSIAINHGVIAPFVVTDVGNSRDKVVVVHDRDPVKVAAKLSVVDGLEANDNNHISRNETEEEEEESSSSSSSSSSKFVLNSLVADSSEAKSIEEVFRDDNEEEEEESFKTAVVGISVVVDDGSETNDIGISKGKEEDRRPWLIFHIGPQKTGTTTIQSGLYCNAETLARDDNFYYMGMKQNCRGRETTMTYYAPDDECGNAVTRSTEFRMNDFPWFQKRRTKFSEVLEEHSRLGRNVIVSNEHLTQWTPSVEALYKYAFLQHNQTTTHGNSTNINNNITVGGEESRFGFRVKVVVTYRHFFEWLASHYYQFYVDPPIPGKIEKRPGIIEYFEDYLDRLVRYDPNDNNTDITTTARFDGTSRAGGNKYTSTETQIWKWKDQETTHGGVWVYLRFASRPELYERVDVFDMHQQPKAAKKSETTPVPERREHRERDLFAEFVCQMLPSASNTCRHLLMKNTTEIIHDHAAPTKNFLSEPDTKRILYAGFSLPEYDPTKTNLAITRDIIAWFGRFDTEDPRLKALKRCLGAEYTSQLKEGSWNSLLQMVLLTRSHKKSRHKENDSYYSSLFQSSIPTNHLLLSSQYSSSEDNVDDDDDDLSWIPHTKAAHDEAFDKFVAKGKLCEADVDKILEDKSFVRFAFTSRNTTK